MSAEDTEEYLNNLVRRACASDEKDEHIAELEAEIHEFNATPFADRVRENVALRENNAALEAENDRLLDAIERIHAAPGKAGEITSAALNEEEGE